MTMISQRLEATTSSLSDQMVITPHAAGDEYDKWQGYKDAVTGKLECAVDVARDTLMVIPAVNPLSTHCCHEVHLDGQCSA
jgi:hypothetical protein